MNAALRKALAASRLTEIDVAAHLGVDPKTVRRWLSGQRPYPRHRWALADLLQTEEDTLWPQNSQKAEAHTPVSEHVQRVYAHRWQVPREVWWDLFSSAEQEIGILVYSGLFLADDAGMVRLLASRARDGVNIRIILGDPESPSVKQRGKEEGVGDSVANRSRNSILLLRGPLKAKNISIRIHATTLYGSIFFADKRLLVNQHIYGFPAAEAPVLEMIDTQEKGPASIYMKAFDEVWRGALKVDE